MLWQLKTRPFSMLQNTKICLFFIISHEISTQVCLPENILFQNCQQVICTFSDTNIDVFIELFVSSKLTSFDRDKKIVSLFSFSSFLTVFDLGIKIPRLFLPRFLHTNFRLRRRNEICFPLHSHDANVIIIILWRRTDSEL